MSEQLWELVPARRHRDWMDAFNDRHPYRCLPLAIANTFGWEILCPCDVEINFTGGPKVEDITFRATDGYSHINHVIDSNFSRGIMTFYTGYLFHTEPGWQLMASGPLNDPKDGLCPLTGLIETSWLPYPFTMNWQITRPGVFHFKKGEPFCHIVPVPEGYITDIEPEIYNLSDNPELMAEKEEFQKQRADFRKRLAEGDPEATKQAWQRHYFTGRTATGNKAPESHVNKLSLSTPVDRRGTPVETLASGLYPLKEPLMKDESTPPPQTPALPHKPEPCDAYPCVTDSGEFLYFENFLDHGQCRELIDVLSRNTDRLNAHDEAFFANRVLWMSRIPENEKKALSIMQQARFVASSAVGTFFGNKNKLYDDGPQLVKWGPGMNMPAHADNEHPDHKEEHRTPYRKYAGVVFLNEDFEGGYFYFETLKLRVRPRAGLLVGFKGDMSHMHGVSTVRSGLRYTMPMWFGEDETKIDPTYSNIY